MVCGPQRAVSVGVSRCGGQVVLDAPAIFNVSATAIHRSVLCLLKRSDFVRSKRMFRGEHPISVHHPSLSCCSFSFESRATEVFHPEVSRMRRRV